MVLERMQVNYIILDYIFRFSGQAFVKKKLLKYKYGYVCVTVCGYVHKCQQWRQRHHLPNIGAGNQTQVAFNPRAILPFSHINVFLYFN